MLKCVVCLFTCVVVPSAAFTQEAKEHQRFSVEKQRDGSLKVVPGTEPTIPTRSEQSPTDKQQTLTAEALNLNLNRQQLLEQLKEQEFWVKSEPGGAISSVYVVPRGVNPPETMLDNVGEGETVSKIKGISALEGYMPSTESMTEVMSELMTNAKTAVCGMPARPKEFGTVVDVSAGFGVTGRIEFNATWDTADLCKP